MFSVGGSEESMTDSEEERKQQTFASAGLYTGGGDMISENSALISQEQV